MAERQAEPDYTGAYKGQAQDRCAARGEHFRSIDVIGRHDDDRFVSQCRSNSQHGGNGDE